MNKPMPHTVLIVAGGRGARMGSEQPKQFLPLAGRPILMHTIEAFDRWDNTSDLLLVLPADQRDTWQQPTPSAAHTASSLAARHASIPS